MKNIKDYSNPFDAIAEFENALADFTGAPYAITTDCCTHAIEIVFRLLNTKQVVSGLSGIKSKYKIFKEDWDNGEV